MTQAFNQQEQFVPTRLYSDVTRIAPPHPRHYVESKLASLGYSFKKEETTLQFDLHPIDYPEYLIPDLHPLLDSKAPSLILHFDHPGKTALLQMIELQKSPHLPFQEIPSLYLEPELVSTFTRSGGSRHEIRTFLKFDEIPATVWKAIIAIEDQHFLEHKGLDPRGIARAIWVNLRTFSLAQGGSTITQQLVKNLMARRTKNLFQKVNEIFLSLLLEAKLDKEEILERYLNEVYLGQVGNLEVHGVAEGAEHFFGKKLNDLSLGEIALMAGLIRGPGYYSPYRYRERALERQRLVLQKMVKTNQITEAEEKAALKQSIVLAPPQTVTTKAPYFSDYVKAELIRQLKGRMSEEEIISTGFRIYTTLDTQLNLSGQQIIAREITRLENQYHLTNDQRLEGALACVDHTTGFIRALIGGKSYAQSNFNRILNMKRQVGSTFKPIVYLTAFLKGKDPQGIPYGPGHPANDAPWSLSYNQDRQKWSPKNYEKEFRGWISYRTALAQSVNTVAAKLGYEIGIDPIIKTSQSLGIESPLPAVPALSLGVAELSPIELLRVYATFANRGVQNELTVIRSIVQPDGTTLIRTAQHSREVFPPSPIDLLNDLLQSVFTEGTASATQKRLGFEYQAAGKTGTTSNHRDAWFAGFTPQFTTVTWVGMDQVSEKKPVAVSLTGANAALPIWISFMETALNPEPPIHFPPSPLLVDIPIDRHTGKAALPNCPAEQVIVDKYMLGQEPQGSQDTSCEPNWPTSQ